ncbi:hypothetical protein D3C85_935170 [compost metagenome]
MVLTRLCTGMVLPPLVCKPVIPLTGAAVQEMVTSLVVLVKFTSLDALPLHIV